VIAFQASGVWHHRDMLPERHGPIPREWSHDAGRAVDEAPLDHCFTGWDGTARAGVLTMTADPVFGNLQVFTPPGTNFFCVEPVSHVPDAINRDPGAAQAMAVLDPGQTLHGAMHFFARQAN